MCFSSWSFLSLSMDLESISMRKTDIMSENRNKDKINIINQKTCSLFWHIFIKGDKCSLCYLKYDHPHL